MFLIKKGAEAEIYVLNNRVIKRRIVKTYRIKEIDDQINKSRTKKEVNILKKLNKYKIPVPKVYKQENYDIEMEKINGIPIKNILNKDLKMSTELLNYPLKSDKEILIEIGNIVFNIHKNNIIHGDLTTLNFIYNKDKIYIIDFGLSFESYKDEDKAVDLYLFEKSIQSAHVEELIEYFYLGYKLNDSLKKKLVEIRNRGRKR